MRGMRKTRTPGSTRKAGASLDFMTPAQRELYDIIKAIDGEFTLLDVAAKTGKPVQQYGVCMRALIRMGLAVQTYRSPSSKKPSKYEVMR